LIICDNHLCKQFNFINCIDFVILVYIRKDSLKKIEIHQNMSEYCTKHTLLLMYSTFVGLNNKSYTIHGTYIKILCCYIIWKYFSNLWYNSFADMYGCSTYLIAVVFSCICNNLSSTSLTVAPFRTYGIWINSIA
jgi:hypothetical protein